MPDCMFFSVLFPTTKEGNSNFMFFNKAALEIKFAEEVSTPGAITPPINSFFEFITSYVVAVPKSITIKGDG